MKIRHLIALTALAGTAYHLFQQREQLQEKIKNGKELKDRLERSSKNIQEQLQILQSYQKPLKELAQDLQYKVRSYQMSIAGNLQEIQQIQKKYLTDTEKGFE
ncbi:hypothetical protein [Streptococcus sp. DD13]|uniref:hypothetical protein n=1 Tax=Streptococcus sp. DD13 TaxID=1777881 RepID=UPI000793340E|nr:hypothetical protein [Streptococcus sp. DD13]KXT77305.1 hypothetical protein STRDD13_01553 [Streptococcus sp. DD13]